METQPINTTATPGTTGQATAPGQITRDAFLKLLITQLEHQDPLNPLDNQEFVSQLTAFNSLDQLIGLNEKMEGLQSQQLLLSQMGAVSLIGKQIVATGNEVELQDGGQATLHYRLASDASQVTVRIMDANGRLVQTLQAGSQQSGERSVLWDGRDSLGQSLPSGLYTFEVNAVDGNGRRVEAIGRTQGVVTGVNLSGGEAVLAIGGIEVPLSAVVSVQQ